ncbi:predicted protein [Streptomyces iranensis]|uniref:Uncharacterized protein n=1 Tax=Streptomyces iranensis TaxID=576784 RepID=A0A060ZQJ3_9ACTN|nr:hypothetical protein [Streptomyces iranensis]CDR05611.1 predicted protein [Streptomyces iranensis]
MIPAGTGRPTAVTSLTGTTTLIGPWFIDQ